MYVYFTGLLVLQLLLVQTQVPFAIVVPVSVNGMVITSAPAVVFVVLEMPGVLGRVTTEPSSCPPSVVPLSSVAVAPETVVELTLMFVVSTA